MFNLNSKPETKAGSASTSSHAMFGWVTPRLQNVRPSCEDGSLLNQEASNAFQPFHCWNPCLIKQYLNPTAVLTFSSYLPVLTELCLSLTIQGIRAVFTNIHDALKQFIVCGRRGMLPPCNELQGIRYPCAPRRTQ